MNDKLPSIEDLLKARRASSGQDDDVEVEEDEGEVNVSNDAQGDVGDEVRDEIKSGQEAGVEAEALEDKVDAGDEGAGNDMQGDMSASDKEAEMSRLNDESEEVQEDLGVAVDQGLEAGLKIKTPDKVRGALDDKMLDIAKKSLEARIEAEANLRGMPYINLKGFPISPDALRAIDEDKAQEMKMIVFFHNGPEMRVGAVDPYNEEAESLRFQLAERHKTHAVLYQISPDSFNEAVKLYGALPKVRQVVKGVQIKAEELEAYQNQMQGFSDIDKIIDGANITDVLAVLIAASLKLGSSDIHIEAEEKGIMVRFRVDGVLQEVATLDKHDWKKIINRIKLIASLKINITDKPQDGRFTIFQKETKIDVRTSTIPTAWGESVVMRILNPESIQLEFDQLGFRKAALSKLLAEIKKPNGMIITTGPTGSGKTTTLYSVLRKLNTPDVKIITLEDPVEYKLEGINQSQIDHSKNYDFSDGLRSIMRQDPDIVMVGEIRDLETANAAIQASLTGHLLLSTIHTNDAAGAVPRFLSLGVSPAQLAPALSVVMGQRLLRRLCKECKVEHTDVEEDLLKRANEKLDAISEASGEEVPSERKFWKAVGCDACNNTGYKGRVGVYEILIKNSKIEEFILSGEVSEYKMREVAYEQGMVDMTQDGLLKALEGETSLEEVQRVTGL